MADIEIREVRDGDAEALLASLRQEDRDELEALQGHGRESAALAEGLARSVLSWVGTADGQVACIFGVAPLNILSGVGAPWLLGTRLIDKHRGAFIRRNPAYIARMLTAFPHLVNVVDARNTKAIAWLKRMGFTILPAQPLGVAGLPFHSFFKDA